MLSGLSCLGLLCTVAIPAALAQSESSLRSCTDVRSREESEALQRARNLARQAAERENGGLSRYQAEAAMSNSQAVSETVACQYDPMAQTFTFRFLGGEAGWVQKGQQPTIESVVSVTSTKPPQIRIDYNGPIRPQ
jgi:hypothetical protein